MASNPHSTNLSIDSTIDGKNENSLMKEDFNVYKTTYVKMYDFQQLDNTKDGQSEITLTINSKMDGSIFETHVGTSTSKKKAFCELAKNFLKNTALERPRGLKRKNRAISSPNATIEKKKIHFRFPNQSPINSQSEQIFDPSRTDTHTESYHLQNEENSNIKNNNENQTGGFSSSVPFAIFEENANSSFAVNDNHRQQKSSSENHSSYQDDSADNRTTDHHHSNSVSKMNDRNSEPRMSSASSESGQFIDEKCPNSTHSENCPVKHSEGYIYDRLPPEKQVEFLNKKRKKGTRGGKRWKVKLNYTVEECLDYRIVKNELKVKIKWKSHDDISYRPSYVPIEDCWGGSNEILKDLVNIKKKAGDQKLAKWLENNGYIFKA